MATIELNEAELQLVRMVLKSKITSLNTEIDHTDRRAFRDLLKGERDALERVAARLPARHDSGQVAAVK